MNPTNFSPRHFRWSFNAGVATITLDRPEKKNALTFDSYAELRDTFVDLAQTQEVRSIVLTGANGNFCSGGDVHEIIGALVRMDRPGLQRFTRMTGDLIIAMLRCPRVIVAAIDGACVGAGAAIAMASDVRFGTARSRLAFLFVKVGLAGCDMGACAMLPRIVGHGRAADLLYTGRSISGEEALQWGFLSRLCEHPRLGEEAAAFARDIADGPLVAHGITKRMLVAEWNLDLVRAVEEEARAQAECMETKDFRRAYDALAHKGTPEFEGN